MAGPAKKRSSVVIAVTYLLNIWLGEVGEPRLLRSTVFSARTPITKFNPELAK